MERRRRFNKAFSSHSVEGGVPSWMRPLQNIYVSDDEKLKLARSLHREGKTTSEIARALGYASVGAATNYLKKHGLHRTRTQYLPGQGKIPSDYKKHQDPVVSHANRSAAQKLRRERSREQMPQPKALKGTPEGRAKEAARVREYRERKKAGQPINPPRVTVPKWYEEARQMRADKVPIPEIAAKFKVSPSRVSQITGPTWEGYVGTLKKKSKKEEPKQEPKENPAMSDRQFDKYFIKDPTDNRLAVSIKCAKCGKVQVFKKHGIINPTHAANVFRNAGWAVGAGPRADRCQDCVGGLGKYTPTDGPLKHTGEPKADPIMDAIKQGLVEAKNAEQHAIEEAPVMKHENIDARSVEERLGIAPAQRKEVPKPVVVAMTRMDRRTIFAKLNDNVYGDESYLRDWNDEKVAADLGVSLEWVAEVREAEFGPATNEKQAKMAQLMELKVTIETMTADVMAAMAAADIAIKQFDSRSAKLKESIDAFSVLVGTLSG